VAQANVKLTVDATNATRALQGVQNKTNTLQKSFGGLQRVIAGVGLTVLARQAISTSANFEKLNVRLGLLTKASGTFARSQELAAQAQKSFGLSATEALEGITDITARLQPLGVSVEDIKTTFFGFNTAAKLAGASAIESSNAFRQLAQALGSGRLQGDEFRSISEQIPTILKPVADELGTTVGELKKFSSEGKITSAVVIRALKKIETEGGASLAALLKNDPTQVFKNLSNEAENLSRAFGDVLAPAILPVIRGLSDATRAITEFINSGAGQITLVFTATAVAIKGLTVVIPILSAQLLAIKGGFAALVVAQKIYTGSLIGIKATLAATSAGFATATVAANAFKIALAKTGIGVAVILLGTLAAKFLDNRKAASEAAEATKEFNKQLGIIEDKGGEAADIIEEITKKQRELNKARIRPATKKRLNEDIKELETRKKILEGEKKRTKIEADMKKFNDMTIRFLKEQNGLEQKLSGKTDEQISLEQKILDIKKQFKPEDAEQLINLLKKNEKLKESVDLMEEEKKKAEELKEKFADIGEEIEGSIKNNLRDSITGAQSFGQAMTNILNKIRDKIIDTQLDKAFSGFQSNFKKSGGKGIGGFLGGIIGGLFANGGRPPVGKASIVGERGPELFVPKVTGTIIPNSKLGGGDNVTNMVTVNVDASGSSVSGNNADAQALGAVIGAAVQAQLVKEKRAGGLLSR
jgi:tape measure domain-containing protein